MRPPPSASELGQIVKSLVFVAPDDGDDLIPFVVLASGANRVDIGRLAAIVGESGMRRASAREANELTGFPIGGIPPIGHIRPIRVVMDPDLGRYQVVWAAAGTPTSVFAVPPGTLRTLANATVAPVAEQAPGRRHGPARTGVRGPRPAGGRILDGRRHLRRVTAPSRRSAPSATGRPAGALPLGGQRPGRVPLRPDRGWRTAARPRPARRPRTRAAVSSRAPRRRPGRHVDDPPRVPHLRRAGRRAAGHRRAAGGALRLHRLRLRGTVGRPRVARQDRHTADRRPGLIAPGPRPAAGRGGDARRAPRRHDRLATGPR